MKKSRRFFLKTLAKGIFTFPFIKGVRANYKPRIVIVGSGFGGGTCIRYLEKFYGTFDVILIEKSNYYYTCPFSNYVIGGFRPLNHNKFSLDNIKKRGVKVIIDKVNFIDSEKKIIRFSSKNYISYDWLILSPGVSFKWDQIEGYTESVNETNPHGWNGRLSGLISQKIDSLDNNSKIIISAPDYPYRCPPAPYERASMIAHRLKNKGYKFKILIFDNKDFFSKQKLFFKAWKTLYPGSIEWIPRKNGGQIKKFNKDSNEIINSFGERIKADFINIIPNQKAASIFFKSNLIYKDWCEVNPTTFELKNNKFIHVIGDSINAWDMPKSAFSANSQGKVCAENVKNIILQKEILNPVFLNTCYSLASKDYGFSISSWYKVNSSNDKIVSLGSKESNIDASLSSRKEETYQSHGWYETVTNEIFG